MIAAAREKAQAAGKLAGIAAGPAQIGFSVGAFNRPALGPQPARLVETFGGGHALTLGGFGARAFQRNGIRCRRKAIAGKALFATPCAMITREARIQPPYAHHLAALVYRGALGRSAQRAGCVMPANAAVRDGVDQIKTKLRHARSRVSACCGRSGSTGNAS